MTEIDSYDPDNKELVAQEIFKWIPRRDSFRKLNRSIILERTKEKMGLDEEEMQEELQRRQTVLEWMVGKNIRRYTDVASVIREYYADSERIYRKARMGSR